MARMSRRSRFAVAAFLFPLAGSACRRPWEPPPAYVSVTSDLGHPDASVRAAAAARLCELWPERRILPPLAQALTDVDDGVAHAAAVSLIRIGRPGLASLLEGVRSCHAAGRSSRASSIAGLSLQLGPEAGA